MWRSVATGAVLAGLLAGCGVGAGGGAASDPQGAGGHLGATYGTTAGGTIVFRKAIGPIHIGEPLAHVRATLGPGATPHMNSAGVIFFGGVGLGVGKDANDVAWYPASKLLAWGDGGKVTGIATANPRYVARDSLRVGMTRAQAAGLPDVNCHEPIAGICLAGPAVSPETTFVLHEGTVSAVVIGPHMPT